jgi:glycosyltransferase involved in cell wall biosynthesis
MIGVKYISHFDREGSGYGEAAKRYILGLDRLGVPLTWTPTVPKGGWGPWYYQPLTGAEAGDRDLDPFCNRQIPYDVVVVHMVPEYYPQWAAKEQGKRLVGYTVWETNKLPQHWPPDLSAVEKVLVPCSWNKQVFEEASLQPPVEVVPHSLERNGPIDPNLGIDIGPDEFVFYAISTWTPRKAISKLIDAYLMAFTTDDPVVLVLKTNEWDMSRYFIPYLRRFLYSSQRSLNAMTKRFPRPARIVLITDRLSDAQIRGLHQRGDCFVSLCRSEGWGMGAFDAAGCGNPVIITGYGGQLAYLPKDLAYLIDYRLVAVDVAMGKRSYSPDQMWAEPEIDHAAQLMRQVFENRDEARERGQALRDFVHEKFNEETVARRFLSAIADGAG